MTTGATPPDAKATLRAALRARRAALELDEVERRSAGLTEALRAHPAWAEARSIAAFVGVRAEPDTWALLHDAWSRGVDVWLPWVRGDALAFVRTVDRAQLVPGCFGLLEPAPGTEPPRALADVAPPLVLVPGLGFGRDGARIGFGRGYYDRALGPLRDRSDVLRFGVVFATFVDPSEGPIPMDAHDVPMDALVTDAGLLVCP